MLEWIKKLGSPSREDLQETAEVLMEVLPSKKRRRPKKMRADVIRRGMPPLLPPTGEERDDN